ncbi:MAG: hypothetical protein IJV67_01125 [Clostridia bacterium]|nr:hypothetical protein [Clostridia bacterium]
MVTYEQAKEIAVKANKKVNTCNEYKKAYHFFKKLNEDEIVEGDNGVVVLKENGRAINWITFILDYHPEKNPKEIQF